MKKLDNNELREVKGGFGFWGILAAVSGFIFVCGIFDGITRPVKCN